LDENLEPVCPSLIDSFYLKTIDEFVDCPVLKNNYPMNDFNYLKVNFANAFSFPHYHIGIILIEMFNDFRTLNEASKSECLFALYELLRLYDKLRLFHGDPHPGNILINKKYPYFTSNTGKAILIDFGRTFNPLESPSLSERYLKSSLTEFNNKLKTSSVFENVERFLYLNLLLRNKLNIELNEHPKYFEWLGDLYAKSPETQEKITRLHNARMQFIQHSKPILRTIQQPDSKPNSKPDSNSKPNSKSNSKTKKAISIGGRRKRISSFIKYYIKESKKYNTQIANKIA
jgi:hypothetical protein